MTRKLLIGIIAFPAAIVIIILAWIAWQYVQDPLDAVERQFEPVSLVRDSVFYDDIIPAPREYHKVVLQDSDMNSISCIISLPDTDRVENLPVIIILGGLEVGVRTLEFVPEPGNNIIIIYQYPYHPRYWYYGTAVREIPVIRESVLSVPAQVLALRQWIRKQTWADSSRINITGYSFGALFVPAVLNLARSHDIRISETVISYGGTDLYHMLVHNMTNVAQPWRSIVSWLAITAIRGIEPELHVPFMKSDILLINGMQDTQIPEECWRNLHALTPEPKTVILLDEGHMHARKPELTKKLVRITQEWLLDKGAVNP
jgi:hypothetical protein